jgi:hypothetical protein
MISAKKYKSYDTPADRLLSGLCLSDVCFSQTREILIKPAKPWLMRKARLFTLHRPQHGTTYHLVNKIK